MQRQFAAGEILFRQGDASETVYLIKSGTVAVLKERHDSPVVLGHVGAGEFLGEMGAVEALPRSATAKAETAVEADIFEKSQFLELVSRDSELAFNLIRRLSMRLRDVDNRIADMESEPADGAGATAEAAADPSRPITIRGGTFALQMYVGTDPITVPALPYTVGRIGDGVAERDGTGPNLGILDPEPYRLSKAHFTLYAEDGRLQIRDCDSELGTIVNGQGLGRDFPLDHVPLKAGENVVVAGGDGSPYKFLIDI
ncbi:MAG: Crp/Fnr family transcriptional regulator [Alphaproteobacteria bacterium]|nr:Crp/Fnr family transcriptional regulator [Alphaproteobacteria bacterium]